MGGHVDLGDGAGLDDPSPVHHRDAVAGLGQHGEVVRDQQQRQAQIAAQLREQV
ncbi:hypothetical protein [Streptomyces sp. NPDC002785]|uniref:hypothetical protein n=1 Tax=Streptomyces sp. NPDC002785 TaxID=3154543 RepID=UPI0033231FB1